MLPHSFQAPDRREPRGADARIHARPERVLVSGQSNFVLVRAEAVPDHPMVKSFDPDLRAA